MYLSQEWEGRKGVFYNLHKGVKEGLSEEWEFRLRPEGPKGSHLKVEGSAI